MPRAQTIVATLPLLLCAAMPDAHAQQQQPTWSRAASVLDKSCSRNAAKFLSPDRHLMVEVRCTQRRGYDPIYSLRLQLRKKLIAEFALPIGAQEIVWSPDSHAFFLNGGQSASAGFFVKLYTIDDDTELREHDVTSLAQHDMVHAFPPCKAANLGDDCKQIESNPEYNMSGLGFTPDSKAIFIFAEIPCSSSYGGIMCQIRGYEVDIASGQILQRLSPQQVKLHWQRMAMWDINLPDPPVYNSPTKP